MENQQTENYIERLIEISVEKQKKLEDILTLTRAQAKAIEEEGIESLGKLLDDKQKIIDEINKNDEEFYAYYEKIKEKYGVKSLENLETLNTKNTRGLQEVISSIKKTLQEISRLEKENNKKVKETLEDLSSKIRKINQGKKASNVYSRDSETNAVSYLSLIHI